MFPTFLLKYWEKYNKSSDGNKKDKRQGKSTDGGHDFSPLEKNDCCFVDPFCG